LFFSMASVALSIGLIQHNSALSSLPGKLNFGSHEVKFNGKHKCSCLTLLQPSRVNLRVKLGCGEGKLQL
jgi:hypothetical protein